MIAVQRQTPEILVCHPGRQHSHQLAMALAERGMLAEYVTGIPTSHMAGRGLARLWLRQSVEAYTISINPDLVTHVYVASALRAAARRLVIRSRIIGHLADDWFDRYVCKRVDRLHPSVVVAYENSALFTFRRAKKLGIKTVLDAASVHHHWQDRFFHPVEGPALHRRITHRKDQEIALADHVITVSELARESYLEAGVSPERVHTIPVGVDVNLFQPRSDEKPADQSCRFVYVGNSSPLKGLDVLRDAIGRLRAASEDFTITLIGRPDASELLETTNDKTVRKGWMSHDHLASEIPQHDILVLPSYFDSFGMVVAEAMACGLPVIVTENVGSKEMVSQGVNGLIVSVGDAESLADAMRWFIQHMKRLPEMSRAARESAERYDWSVYRRRVTEFLASV